MVEGPGCKLKGIKIKARLKGQRVVAVKGNAVNKEVTKKSENKESTFHQLIGRQLEDVQTLGKELFMYFGDLCLRVHFLMAGQSFINNERIDKDGGGKAQTAVLEVQMSKDLLSFRNSSAMIRPSEPCKLKHAELNDLDICSPIFNFTRAVALVMEQKDRQACDVLLDQLILPGVGNIIKNEALFDSGIKPSTKISELKKEHVTFLIKMTRDFTDIFYKCRRDGKPLYPYYKIYGRRRCKQCDGKVTICRQGEDSERMTYFCENCQTNELKTKQRKLPQKNSLLGWVKTSEHTAEAAQDWTCSFCTVINSGSSTKCSCCLNTRSASIPQSSCSSSHVQTSEQQAEAAQDWNCSFCTVINYGSNINCSCCLNTRSSSIPENSFSPSSQRDCTASATIGKLEELSPLSNRKGTKRILQPANSIPEIQNKVRKVESGSHMTAGARSKGTGSKQKGSSEGQGSGSTSSDTPSKIPPCPTHKKKCNMKEVRKEGPNLGRWFFSCVVRSCNYFQWADEKFPICPGHGKPCTIRTVLKIGPNNGRRFFACKMPKNKQCKFFEWAEGYE